MMQITTAQRRLLINICYISVGTIQKLGYSEKIIQYYSGVECNILAVALLI